MRQAFKILGALALCLALAEQALAEIPFPENWETWAVEDRKQFCRVYGLDCPELDAEKVETYEFLAAQGWSAEMICQGIEGYERLTRTKYERVDPEIWRKVMNRELENWPAPAERCERLEGLVGSKSVKGDDPLAGYSATTRWWDDALAVRSEMSDYLHNLPGAGRGAGLPGMAEAATSGFAMNYPGSQYNPREGNGLWVQENGLIKVYVQNGNPLTMEKVSGQFTEKFAYAEDLYTVSDGRNYLTLQIDDKAEDWRERFKFIDARLPDMADESSTVIQKHGAEAVGIKLNAMITLLNDVYHEAVAGGPDGLSVANFARDLLLDGTVRAWALAKAEEVYQTKKPSTAGGARRATYK